MSEHLQDHGGYEQDVDGGDVLKYIVGFSILIVATVFLVYQYAIFKIDFQYKEVALTPVQKKGELIRLNAKKKISQYDIIDKEERRFQIPIERAMDMMLQESFLKNTTGLKVEKSVK